MEHTNEHEKRLPGACNTLVMFLEVRLGSNVDVVGIDDARLENLIQTAEKLARRGCSIRATNIAI